jgi:hypothetical protein
MSSPTTSAKAVRSTSTPATGSTTTGKPTPSNWTEATKLQVRKKGPTLTAARASQAGVDTPVGGHAVTYGTGDWLISQGTHLLEILSAASFPGAYEILHEGQLTLSPADRQQLERTLGLGATASVVSLIAAVERLAAIEVGTIKIDFSPGQLAEIKHRAAKRGHTVQRELELAVERVSGDIFHNQ